MERLFETQKRQSTVNIVIESIRQLLLTKKLLPGQRIPSEAEISDGLGVSRGSVREAMKILSAFGIVEIKVGDGTYIPSEPKSAVIDPLLFSFLLYNPDIQELSEFRRLIELDIVELIIQHKGDNKIERQMITDNLQELDGLRKTQAEYADYAKNDMEFHHLLGKACCNRLAQKVYDFVLDYLEHTILDTHAHQNQGSVSYAVHSKIVEAIDANNLELAKNAIYRSVDAWKKLQVSFDK